METPREDEASVTLDPDTAHPDLVLSEDGKSVRRGDMRQPLPTTHERFDSELCVLGREGFTSGRHCWEVEVEDGRHWAVGVARESINRTSCRPEGKVWAVELWGDQFCALSSTATTLPLSQALHRIRVCLDCDQRQVTFFNAADKTPIFTFPAGSVSGQRIRSWFRVGPRSQLSLCP